MFSAPANDIFPLADIFTDTVHGQNATFKSFFLGLSLSHTNFLSQNAQFKRCPDGTIECGVIRVVKLQKRDSCTKKWELFQDTDSGRSSHKGIGFTFEIIAYYFSFSRTYWYVLWTRILEEHLKSVNRYKWHIFAATIFFCMFENLAWKMQFSNIGNSLRSFCQQVTKTGISDREEGLVVEGFDGGSLFLWVSILEEEKLPKLNMMQHWIVLKRGRRRISNVSHSGLHLGKAIKQNNNLQRTFFRHISGKVDFLLPSAPGPLLPSVLRQERAARVCVQALPIGTVVWEGAGGGHEHESTLERVLGRKNWEKALRGRKNEKKAFCPHQKTDDDMQQAWENYVWCHD